MYNNSSHCIYLSSAEQWNNYIPKFEGVQIILFFFQLSAYSTNDWNNQVNSNLHGVKISKCQGDFRPFSYLFIFSW